MDGIESPSHVHPHRTLFPGELPSVPVIADATMNSSPESRFNDVIYQRAIASFNHAHFFEAHELFEELWRSAPSAQRLFFQGLVQLSVAFHHYSQGNRIGAESVLRRALQNLASYPEQFGGVELSALRQSSKKWIDALAHRTPVPAPPLLEFS